MRRRPWAIGFVIFLGLALTGGGYAAATNVVQSEMAGPEQVDPVPTSGFPTPAHRPNNSRLNTDTFQSAFGLHLPPWQQGVDRMLAEIL